MKLRIKGNSLRLRVSCSDVDRLLEKGRIEETIHFGFDADARLTYALEHANAPEEIAALHRNREVAVVLSSQSAQRWAASPDQIGIYGSVRVHSGELALLVEKDFACLDDANADNEDTFPNPNAGAVC